MLAVIFVRTGSRHNGGECNHRVTVRRDATSIHGEQCMASIARANRKKLRYSPCEINRKLKGKK